MKFFNVEFLGSLMLELFLGLRVNILYMFLWISQSKMKYVFFYIHI